MLSRYGNNQEIDFFCIFTNETNETNEIIDYICINVLECISKEKIATTTITI